MEKGEGEGGDSAGINMPTEIFQRLCQRTTTKNKGVSPDVVHMWSNISRGRQGKGMLRDHDPCKKVVVEVEGRVGTDGLLH